MLEYSTSSDFHFPWSKSAPHTPQRVAAIATLLATFELARRNDVGGPSGPAIDPWRRSCRSRLAANIAIRARRRRIRGAVDDVCFIFRHEIQKRPVSGIFARGLFLLTRPQMVSTDFPNVFLRIARFISPNSADAGSSSFAAIVVFALAMTGSGVSAGRPRCGSLDFCFDDGGAGFFSASWGFSRTGQSTALPSSPRPRTWLLLSRNWSWMKLAPVQSADCPPSC